MSRRRDERARVLGPYWIENEKRWRVTTVEPGSNGERTRRHVRYFQDGEEAKNWKLGSEARFARLEGTTIDAALTGYKAHLAKKGTKPISYNETDRRLRLFFPDTTLQLARITPEKAAGYYDAFQVGRSVDYHRNTLAEAKSFVRWCVGQHQIKENPLESVEGVGARSTGKAQLTGNEAHVFYAWCVWKASRGDEAAIAVLLCLTLALRQKDVRIRLVRDVDLDAMVLRISDGKTKKSNRPRMVPEVLRPFLRKLVVGRGPLEPLFPAEGGGFHTKTWLRAAMVRFCRDAGVPYICPHALKGQAASVLADSGELSEKIAAHLSHEKVTTTERHYTPRGAVAAAQAGRGLELIQGGAG